jgi:hypothetical protein
LKNRSKPSLPRPPESGRSHAHCSLRIGSQSLNLSMVRKSSGGCQKNSYRFSRPLGRTAATRRASPVASSVSTASPHSRRAPRGLDKSCVAPKAEAASRRCVRWARHWRRSCWQGLGVNGRIDEPSRRIGRHLCAHESEFANKSEFSIRYLELRYKPIG